MKSAGEGRCATHGPLAALGFKKLCLTRNLDQLVLNVPVTGHGALWRRRQAPLVDAWIGPDRRSVALHSACTPASQAIRYIRYYSLYPPEIRRKKKTKRKHLTIAATSSSNAVCPAPTLSSINPYPRNRLRQRTRPPQIRIPHTTAVITRCAQAWLRRTADAALLLRLGASGNMTLCVQICS